MTNEEAAAQMAENARKYERWENSLEGIAYNTQIDCPVGHDDYLIVEVLSRLPVEVREKAQETIHFIVMSDTVGTVLRTYCLPHKEQKQTEWVFLNLPRRLSRKRKLSVIAHEIAHVLLGHTGPEHGGGEKDEEAADDQIEAWGFERSYRPREKWWKGQV